MLLRKIKSWCDKITMAIVMVALIIVSWNIPNVTDDAISRADLQMTALSVADELYYGRQQLLAQDNLRAVYDALVAGIGAQKNKIDFPSALSEDDFNKVYELYRMDHSEHYWLPNTYTPVGLGNKVYYLQLEYYTGFDMAAFDTAAAAYLELVNGVTSQYEIALILHDALVNNVNYVTEATNAHNAYGAIVAGEAVCEGYAKAYQYLLQRCGIMSYLVTGTSHGEGHEWNLVRLDGEFYYTDVTWDDPKNNVDTVYHAYFNITTARLREDHYIEDHYDLLPECNHTDKMYTEMLITKAYDVAEIAARVAPVGTTAVVCLYFDGETDNFETWFDESGVRFSQIIAQTVYKHQTNVTGYYKSCGREHQITIIGPTVAATAIMLDITNLTMNVGNQKTLVATVTPSDYCSDLLEWTSNNPTVVQVSDTGVLSAVGVGSATITATAGGQTATCEVTVHYCEHTSKTRVLAKASTCVAKGNQEYNLCDECQTIFDLDGKVLSGIPYLDLLPHQLSTEIVWEWADDYQSVVAKSYCSQCENIVNVPATITKEITVEPTETESGEAIYTATVEIDGKTYTDSKIGPVPQLPEKASWSKLWREFIKLCSFNGAINGYLGLGLVVGGIFAVAAMINIVFTRRPKKTENNDTNS